LYFLKSLNLTKQIINYEDTIIIVIEN